MIKTLRILEWSSTSTLMIISKEKRPVFTGTARRSHLVGKGKKGVIFMNCRPCRSIYTHAFVVTVHLHVVDATSDCNFCKFAGAANLTRGSRAHLQLAWVESSLMPDIQVDQLTSCITSRYAWIEFCTVMISLRHEMRLSYISLSPRSASWVQILLRRGTTL